MATEDTIQNLIRVTRLYFSAYRKSYAKTTFHIDRKELLALSISTVKELKLFDEGSWVAHVSRVEWNQQEAGKAGVIYRTDLLRMAKAGDLEHIPGKAEIDKVYFKTACPLPILSIRERLQELRLDVESDISADILVMCKWPGKDVINSINLNAQDPDVLMRINRIEEKHLSCFRMLKRMIKPKPPEQQPKPVSDNAGNTKTKERIALKDFIKKHCDLSERPDIDSKCEMLMREHRKDSIKLPLVNHKYRRGLTKLYYLEKLRNNWPDYRMTLTTLPPLKKSDNK